MKFLLARHLVILGLFARRSFMYVVRPFWFLAVFDFWETPKRVGGLL